jgi:hypothetical protein
MVVHGGSWDASVYDGIRQYHEAKGFGPYSHEVALELGSPLFQLSCNQEALHAQSKLGMSIISILLTD